MSEEVTEEFDDSQEELTLEDAKKVIAKVRKEAADRRIKNRELEEKAQKWEEHLQSQKSEVEKLVEEKASLGERVTGLEKLLLREKVARETELDPQDFEFLEGDTKEELLRKAKLLNERRSPANTFAGNRGKHVAAPAEESTQQWFHRMWNSASSS